MRVLATAESFAGRHQCGETYPLIRTQRSRKGINAIFFVIDETELLAMDSNYLRTREYGS